jgi:hypothetical protein
MRRVVVFVFLFSAVATFAQVETTAYLMNSLPQVVNANPAFVPKYKFALGLPGVSSFAVAYANNGFTYNDLVRRENNRLVADLSAWAKNLPDRNYITMGAQTDLFRLGVRVHPKFYFSLHSTAKGYGRAMLPRQLASLLVNGTSPYIGKTLVMEPELQITSYLEHGVGLAAQVTDELAIGGRIKWINGMVGATTERSRFSLTLDDSYQITATGDFRMKSSGFYDLVEGNSDFPTSDFSRNSGWGLDVGTTYRFMEKLVVAASLVDLGQITWKNRVYDYQVPQASYTLTGIDIDQLLNGDATYAEAQLDSLERTFTFTETSGGSFKTPLPGKLYLSGAFEVSKSFTVGALFYSERYQGRSASGISFMMNKHLGRLMSTAISYTISNRSFNNLGAGLSFNLAPIQIYLVGDNLLRLPLSLAAHQNVNNFINNTQVFTLRGGINIVAGWPRDKRRGKPAGSQIKDADHIKVRRKK